MFWFWVDPWFHEASEATAVNTPEYGKMKDCEEMTWS